MKKKRSVLVISSLLSMLLAGSAWAAEGQPPRAVVMPESSNTQVAPRAEQTQWYYRTVNGQKQRRLWSVTESKWLTDWTNV